MSIGSDDVILTVRLDGDIDLQSPPSGDGEDKPPKEQPFVPQWWRQLLKSIQSARGVSGDVGPVTDRRLNAIGRIGRLTPGLAAFGVALASVTASVFALRKAYKMHGESLERITTRLATGPAFQALLEVEDLRVEMARIRRGRELIGRLQPGIQRRTDLQIATEELQTQLSELVRQITEGPVGRIQELLIDASDNVSAILKRLNDSEYTEWFSREFARYWFGEFDRRNAQTGEKAFRSLLGVFSPERDVNRPTDDPDSLFQATIADMFQSAEESL